MWGGKYNPIIPVFRKPPKAWASDFPGDISGFEITKGYVEFFEPDAFVEAQPGLLEKAGLAALKDTPFGGRVFALDEVLAPQPHKDWAELHVGLSVIDCFRDAYRTEQRFHRRHAGSAMTVASAPSSGLAEALFGVYPDLPTASYFSEQFQEVYEPEALPCSPEAWRHVMFNKVATPLSVTSHTIRPQRTWEDDVKIFVFDPGQTVDLIDLWNLRSQPAPIVPVPLSWLPELVADMQQIITEEYRPLQGNPNGIMRNATLEFSRSVSNQACQKALDLLQPGLPSSKDQFGTLSVKNYRDRIWDKPGGGMMNPPTRIILDVEEKRITLDVRETDSKTARYDVLKPSFASSYGSAQIRWVNSVKVANYGAADLATIYPFNTFDRSQPRLAFGADDILIGSEGWSFSHRYSGVNELIQFQTQQQAILGFLERSGMTPRLSEPGHIARQIVDQLGGLWGTRLIADAKTLNLMNDMAGGIRRRQNGSEETFEQFDPRSRDAKTWVEVLNARNKRSYNNWTIEHLTKANILTLGLETQCTNCMHRNWDTVDRLSYQLTCRRCLKPYEFPQGARSVERAWTYRVSGPFSVSDYAKGAYGAVLALQSLSELDSNFRSINFITAVEMERGGKKYEADYIAFHEPDRFGRQDAPTLIIGEAKSFGQGDLIKPKDIEKLKELALNFPGALLTVSVLKNEFSDGEKGLLKKLVRWSRKLAPDGGPRNAVLLLTGHELLREPGPISNTWKDVGGRHAEFADFHSTRVLRDIAESSIQIHLEMPSFEEERRQAWNRRQRKGPNDFPRMPGQWGIMLHSMSGPTTVASGDETAAE